MAERPAFSASPYALHVGLFFLTCLTTTVAGAAYANPGLEWREVVDVVAYLREGLPFSVSLIAILLTHEMGHYLLARHHRVAASLPYFIPLPFGMIGTMGAVIRMPHAVEDRNALVDIGAAGPLAGLLVAVPVLAWGIHLSAVNPIAPGLLEGNSLLYLALKLLIKGQWLPGSGLDVTLHPVAWAGWVGLLVTMINLIPVGQLDGGHLATAYFGDRYERVAQRVHQALLPLGVASAAYATARLLSRATLPMALSMGFGSGMPWLVWWLMLTVMKRLSGGEYHPPVGVAMLTSGRRQLCRWVLVAFVAIFAPVPWRWTL